MSRSKDGALGKAFEMSISCDRWGLEESEGNFKQNRTQGGKVQRVENKDGGREWSHL